MDIPASLFCRNFGHYQRHVSVEPIQVHNHGHVVGVFLSPEQYAALTAGQRVACLASDMPAEAAAALAATDYSHLD